MHAFARISTALAFVAMAGTGIPAAAQQNMALPDVTVTAPTTPPSGAASAGGMPYFGKVRVEEDKWPEIPCAASRVDATAAGTCRRGPPQFTFERGDAQGSRQLSNCQVAHDLVIGTLGALEFEADTLVFDPYYVSAIGHQRQDCYVESIPAHLRAQFLDMNQVTRQGDAWRNFVEGTELITMEFSVGASQCIALEKRGQRWGGGFVSLTHASICQKGGQPVSAENIASVLTTVHVQGHDSVGNLRQ